MYSLSSRWNLNIFVLICASFIPTTTADDAMNGMDMSMDMPMPLASGHVLMYFHFTPGDILWFEGWVPQSVGAMVGACIGLFLLAMVERWVAAMRGVMDGYWRTRAQIAYANKLNVGSAADKNRERGSPTPSMTNTLLMRRSVPFIPAHDIVRGIMQAMQAAIGLDILEAFSHATGQLPTTATSQDWTGSSSLPRSQLEMTDFGTPPAIPTEFQLYNSYVEDPKWQRTFTIVWCSALGAAVVVSSPFLFRSFRNGRAIAGMAGVRERLGYERLAEEEKERTRKIRRQEPRGRRTLEGVLSMLGGLLLWSAPGLGLNVGQIILLLGYAITLIICIVKDSVLQDNSNRAGFMAIAQLPVVFLFATKNSVLSLLLGPGHGYEKLNYIHRWSGRGMFLAAVIHGSLWIQNHLRFGLPILGQQKEGSGVAALGVLCALVLLSLRPIRRWGYEIFFVLHVLAFVAFFVTICYHTIYAPPWIFPPLAFYGFDILLRMLKYRIKDATLEAVDTQMTLIRIPFCDSGWQAGQHVRLRVFFSGRVFESHSLSIMNAPPDFSNHSHGGGGIVLGARVKGDWTRALNSYATAESDRLSLLDTSLNQEKTRIAEVPIHVMLDGPYGGSSIDLGDYESVLLVAGGSGATFTLGLLDDIVGRCTRLNRRGGEKTRRIEFAWCIRSFGSLDWFAGMLRDIANVVAREGKEDLDLHISVFVTCLCNPEEVPSIPNMDVTIQRPSVKELLRGIITIPSLKDGTSTPSPAASVEEVPETVAGTVAAKLHWIGLGGGVAVCASGPESLTREASNAVAALSMTRGIELGGVVLHTEVFSGSAHLKCLLLTATTSHYDYQQSTPFEVSGNRLLATLTIPTGNESVQLIELERTKSPSPIARLPTELLSAIFVFTAEKGMFGDVSWSQASVLGLVCARWRAISLSTPYIWTSLSFTFQFNKQYPEEIYDRMKDHISRSQNRPLEIEIEVVLPRKPSRTDSYMIDRTANRVLGQMLRHSPQWSHFCFRCSCLREDSWVPPRFRTQIRRILDEVFGRSRVIPILESMEVHTTLLETLNGGLTGLSDLETPNLRLLMLTGRAFEAEPSLLFSTPSSSSSYLTTVHMSVTTRAAEMLLETCPNLTSAYLIVLSPIDPPEDRLGFDSDFEANANVFNTDPNDNILVFPYLRSLTFQTSPTSSEFLRNPFRGIWKILQDISCPGLTSFSLTTDSSVKQSTPMQHRRFDVWQALLRFLESSNASNHLQHLGLICVPIIDSDLIQVLERVPWLRSLEVEEGRLGKSNYREGIHHMLDIAPGVGPNRILTPSLFRTLTASPATSSSSETPLLPGLRNVKFVAHTDWLDNSFETMIRSRIGGDCNALESVVLTVFGGVWHLDLDEMEQLRKEEKVAIRVNATMYAGDEIGVLSHRGLDYWTLGDFQSSRVHSQYRRM
ncbi:ferric-chelate reductase Frp1 [Marasmius crinis-equi]|uniref:Ferric-chelate reductase Frp1 n=1 Tax=Marasmius crinis-equi TaxID=585013 RepID=A0ABR3FKL3_9AGAR